MVNHFDFFNITISLFLLFTCYEKWLGVNIIIFFSLEKRMIILLFLLGEERG
jgi:hypothetical protein